MQDYRNVFALIAAVALLQVAGGLLGIVTPLGLDAMGAGTGTVGLVGTLNSIGFMVGAWYSTGLIRRFGNIRVYAAGGAAMSFTFLAMYLAQSIWAWSTIRLVQGAAIAVMFSSAEAWLGAAMPAAKRGSISGVYHLVAKIALILGPFIIVGASITHPEPYVWGAMFLSLALLPITLTKRDQPPPPDREALSIVALFKLAPSGVFACFMAGVMNTGALALLPVYAKSELAGLSDSAATIGAVAAGAAWTGALISQWPAGRLSDLVDRRFVIAGLCLASGLAALALALGGALPIYAALGLLALWGAGSLSFYGVAVAHILDWTPSQKIAQAIAGILFVWAFGSVIGPVLAGLAMKTGFGPGGLFLFVGVMNFVLVFAVLARKAVRGEPPDDEQAPWTPTTPLLAASGEVDPRSD